MDPALREIIQQLLNTIIQALAVFLLAMVTMAAKKLAEKYSITLSDQQKEHLGVLATNAMYYAEEWAARQVSAGAAKPAGATKLRIATAYMQQAKPRLTAVDASKFIHSKLGSIQGLGASKTVGS
jgi:hypothetical protein